MRRTFCLILGICLCVIQGCGYTSKTHIEDRIKSVHVQKIPNRINITGDVTNQTRFKVYRPGLEVELRNALIERFVFDGHLKVSPFNKADSILTAELIDFRRDPLRYNADESIQEFRVSVTASLRFLDSVTEEEIWGVSSLSGDSTYLLAGRLAKTEDEAVAEALEDLARHAVEAILEVW